MMGQLLINEVIVEVESSGKADRRLVRFSVRANQAVVETMVKVRRQQILIHEEPVTELLTPDWQQPRPSPADVEDMWDSIALTRVNLPSEPFGDFIEQVRKSHDNGGAYLAAFDVGPDRVFDWYASRNRLSDDGGLEGFVTHYAVREALPEVRIPSSIPPASTCNNGFRLSDQFELDGTLAHVLYHGGAYHNAQGDGRAEKKFALEVCEAMFGLRYGEISCYPNYDRWIPWFKGIAWYLTLVVFDRRTRRIWFLAMTDTD